MGVFKQAMGVSPLQFATREQVTRARYFIRETSRSLIEIALRSATRARVIWLRYSARDWVGGSMEFRSSL